MTEEYTSNLLLNSGCDSGNMNNWTYSNVVPTQGAIDGSYYFMMSPNSYMEQTVLASSWGGEPTRLFKIVSQFNIPTAQSIIATTILAYITLTLNFQDGTHEIFRLPYQANIQTKDNSSSGWVTINQQCNATEKDITSVKIRIDVLNLIGGLKVNYITFHMLTETALLQDQTYFGVTISKTNGLEIEKSDGSSKVVLNSEKQAFQAKVGDVMVDKIYFDPILGEYKFIGRLYMEHAIVGVGGSIGSMNIELTDSTYVSFRAATIVSESGTSRTMMIGKVNVPGELPTKLDRVDFLAGKLYVYDDLIVQGNISTTTLGGLPLADFLNSPHVRFVENFDYTSMNWYGHAIVNVHDESTHVEVQPVDNWNFLYSSVSNVIKHYTAAEVAAKTDWVGNEVFEDPGDLPIVTPLASTATLEDIIAKVNLIIDACDKWTLRKEA